MRGVISLRSLPFNIIVVLNSQSFQTRGKTILLQLTIVNDSIHNYMVGMTGFL